MENVSSLFGAMAEVHGSCEIHGDYTTTVFVKNGKAGEAYCVKCHDIARRKEDEELREKEIREQAESSKTRRIQNIDIPLRLIEKGYSDYVIVNDAAKSHVELCKAYATNWQETYHSGANIIMCGTPGTGKTHLASVICRQVATQNDARPLYTTVSRMIRHIRSSYNRDADYNESQALKKFTHADLLVIDEVGVKLSSDHERSMLFEIVDERYQRLMPTILISNLKIGEIGKHTDERMVDRLSENGTLMIFDWESHRGDM